MAAGMTDLVPRSQTLDLLRGMEEAGAMSATHLDLSGKLDLDIARCEAVARFLGELHDMSKWCIADLMLQAEVRFGEAAINYSVRKGGMAQFKALRDST